MGKHANYLNAMTSRRLTVTLALGRNAVPVIFKDAGIPIQPRDHKYRSSRIDGRCPEEGVLMVFNATMKHSALSTGHRLLSQPSSAGGRPTARGVLPSPNVDWCRQIRN